MINEVITPIKEYNYLISGQGEVFPAGLRSGVPLGRLARRHQPLHGRRDQHAGSGLGTVLYDNTRSMSYMGQAIWDAFLD